jgi:hypothetical protein
MAAAVAAPGPGPGLQSANNDYLAATILYNLQILPDSLICGTFVLAILLANQSLLAVGTSAALSQFFTQMIGDLFMKYMPENATTKGPMDPCSTGYAGVSFNPLLHGKAQWHPKAPSIYMSTIGFFTGWGGALNLIYKEEINAGALSSSTMIAASVISALLIVLVLAFRYFSGCESIFGALFGLAIGAIFGFFGAVCLGYATGRRVTNIWGIPLLRDRINNGSAVYVCPTQ